jgi:excisionase family DNA binding protein
LSGSDRRHTVPEVARLLGISERGVRDKIERGTLRATKEGKRWIVLLPPEDAVVRGSGSGSRAAGSAVVEEVEPTGSITPAVVEQAIARTGQQYTADLRAMLGELRQVYEGQITAKDEALAAKDETIAELRRRAEVAEAERDRLRAVGRLAGNAHAAQVEEITDLTTRADAAEAWRDDMEGAVRRYPPPGGQHGPGDNKQAEESADPPGGAGGLWARLGRWWRREDGD